MRTWPVTVVETTRIMLARHRDHARAGAAERNFQHVAPFLGIGSEDRQHYVSEVLETLPDPTSAELGEATLLFMRLPEREYHYAARDLIARYLDAADEDFLPTYVETLLTTVPFWDTVDAFSLTAVSPLCQRFGHTEIIDRWSESGDPWLIRAAIQHQRTWGEQTDVPKVLALCDRHWSSDDFYVADAIGITVGKLGRVDRAAALAFLSSHDGNEVARREANKGLGRL